MLIACPHCGPRAHVEFAYERTMDAVLPLDAPLPSFAHPTMPILGNRLAAARRTGARANVSSLRASRRC